MHAKQSYCRRCGAALDVVAHPGPNETRCFTCGYILLGEGAEDVIIQAWASSFAGLQKQHASSERREDLASAATEEDADDSSTAKSADRGLHDIADAVVRRGQERRALTSGTAGTTSRRKLDRSPRAFTGKATISRGIAQLRRRPVVSSIVLLSGLIVLVLWCFLNSVGKHDLEQRRSPVAHRGAADASNARDADGPMSARELAIYINDELLPGQGHDAELYWKLIYADILDGDYEHARGLLGPRGQMVDLVSGKCKTAVEHLNAILNGHPPQGNIGDWSRLTVGQLDAYVDEYLIPSEDLWVNELWKRASERIANGDYSIAAEFIARCLEEVHSSDCRAALICLYKKLVKPSG